MQDQHLVSDPVVAVDGHSSREWMQSADVVVGHHRSRRGARRWASAVLCRYPGCALAVSRHRSGRWWLVGVPGNRTVTVHSDHPSHLPAVRELGILAFHMWMVWRICHTTGSGGEQRRSS